MSPTTEDRCDHELIRDQCAWCRPQARPQIARRPQVDRGIPQLHRVDWSAVIEQANRPRPSRPFPAAFGGYCGECGGSIEEGDMIRMLDGEPIHDECWEDV